MTANQNSDNTDERFSRIERLIGRAGCEKLRDSFIVIVGLGAVGSYALEALVRSGVGKIRVVDFDVINTTNINRQLLALETTVGQDKVEAAANRARLINPEIQIEPLKIFAHTESFDTIFSGEPDIIIDAIDAMTPKAALIHECHVRKLPLISSMGAAMRFDPLKVKIAPLSKTHGCPLARNIRRKLKTMKSPADCMCVYSDEPTATLAETAVGGEVDGKDDYYSRGRKRRVIGSLPTITGIFGLVAAQYALDALLADTPAD